MHGRITVDVGELYRLSSLLGGSSESLRLADQCPTSTQVGDTGVFRSLDHFFGNWRHKWIDLADRLQKLSRGVASAAAAYQSVESVLSAAMVGSAQIAHAPTAPGSSVSSSAARSAQPILLRDLLRANIDEQTRVWRAMSRQQQQQAIRGREADVGELSLASPEIRYAANRQLVFAEYMRLIAEPHPSASDQHRMDLYEHLLRSHANILFFDPSGDGRVGVVQGDLATAKHIAVSVPGIGSSLDTFRPLMDEGQRLYGAAGSDTAVVTWLGYDAPVSVGANPFRDVAEIRGTALAHAGADALVSFVHDLHGVNSHADVTVIGHSYGSLVTGLAARQGLEANRVVFIGSPGVGASNVSQFHLLPGARIYAMEAGPGVSTGGVNVGGDPVSNLGHNLHPFGGVPTERSFGATVVPIGGNIDVRHTHSGYYADHSRSLAALGTIVTGGNPIAGSGGW